MKSQKLKCYEKNFANFIWRFIFRDPWVAVKLCKIAVNILIGI